MDLDDPTTTQLRKQIIQEKPLLRNIYEDWYQIILDHLPFVEGAILEIGSGAGFLKTKIPELITSDIMPVMGNDISFNAERLPFQENCLRAIVLVNVLHHICDPLKFFNDSERCVKKGGAIILIEPWVTPLSRVVYDKLHHEPFDPASNTWILPNNGPLSGGNNALPWIIFQRDRARFEKQSNWQIKIIEETTPFRYLLSGGVSMRNIVPSWMTRPLTYLEKSLPPKAVRNTAMFAIIVLSNNSGLYR